MITSVLLSILQSKLEDTTFYDSTLLYNELYTAENNILLEMIKRYKETGDLPKALKQMILMNSFSVIEEEIGISNTIVGLVYENYNTDAVILLPISCTFWLGFVPVGIPVKTIEEVDIGNRYDFCLFYTDSVCYVNSCDPGRADIAFIPVPITLTEYISGSEHTILPEFCQNAVIQTVYAKVLAKDKDPRYQDELKKAEKMTEELI